MRGPAFTVNTPELAQELGAGADRKRGPMVFTGKQVPNR